MNTSTRSVALLGGMALASAWPTTVIAIPPKKVSDCEAKAIGTAGGKRCIDTNYTKSAIAGTSTYAIKCNAAGTALCCKFSSSGQVQSCRRIGRVAGSPDVAADPSGMGVEKPPRPPRNHSIGPGLLDAGPGLGTQGPAATGAPLSPGRGSAPPPGQIK
jgi:hypothetical protein